MHIKWVILRFREFIFDEVCATICENLGGNMTDTNKPASQDDPFSDAPQNHPENGSETEITPDNVPDSANQALLKAKDDKIAALQDQNMRLQAQMQNLERQSDKRVADAGKYAGTKIVESLLPVLDGFSQALQLGEPDEANTSAKSMYDGLKMSADVLNKVLKKQGIEVIEPSIGDAFNPDFHEAITMQKDENHESGVVLAVAQLGYQLHERVLRPARVVVNS